MKRLPALTKYFLLCWAGCLLATTDASAAPLAAGKQKFLGGIYSGGTSAQETGIPLYWNQVTPENAGKWGSVEGVRGTYNWTAVDAAYNLAKSNGLPFRFHVLLWGAQQPAWIRDLPDNEQLDAIKAWFAAVAARYPDIDYLEVVNEAFHDKPDITWKWLTFVDNSTDPNCGNYAKALGGNGASGWEWVLQAFRLARLYFPNTKLMLNDYGIISDGNATNNYVALINLLKAENLVDVVAEQGHAFNTSGASATNLTNNLNALGATGLPIWITEFDVDGGTNTAPNDATQQAEYQRIFPVLWENPSVIGITTWGYRPGLWRNAQAAFLVLADGTERSAMTWLKNYVATTEPNLRALIDGHPSNQSTTAGASATFSVLARGTPAPTYQWQKSGANIAGATNATLAISNTQPADAGSYRVIVTNSFASITSQPATLTVTATAPVITAQPMNQSVAAGSPVTFTSAASGLPAPTFQWRKNGQDITGATNSSYTITGTTSGDAGSYTVIATNSAGSATSNAALLSITAIPVFTTQPQSLPAFVGANVSFTSAASSTTPISYQWQKNGINLTGATSTTLTLTNVQLTDAGSYAVLATDGSGTATSRFARLVVLVSQSNAISYATTVSATSVTAGGSVNLAYFMTNVGTRTWGANHYLSIRDINGTFVAFSTLIGILPGENTTAVLNFPAPTTPGTYTYYVQALENGVEFFSTQTAVTLTVLAPLTNSITYNTTTFPVSAAPGSNVVFTYNVTNTGTQTWGANHILSLKNNGGTTLSSALLTVLAPGGSKTVNLSFTAPTSPGTYSYTVQAAQTDIGDFNTHADLTLVVLAPRPNAIVYTATRLPDEVAPGAELNLSYSLSNAGTQAWGTGHYVSLRDSAGTFLAFLPLNGIATSGTKNVAFTFTAPTAPGLHTYYVQAFEDGVEFFSTQDIVIVQVDALPLANAITYNATTFPATAAPGATVSFTYAITNRGTRTWGASDYLSFRDVDNTFLGFPSISGVAPGASKTVNISIVAPTTSGIYTYKAQALQDGVAFFPMDDTLVLFVQ